MSFELLILEGPESGRRLAIENAVVFGRSASANYAFPQDNFMSGRHLQVQSAPGGLLLTDKGSTNGTFLNGTRITQAVAGVGSLIKIGTLSMKVVESDVRIGGPVLSSPLRPHLAPAAQAGAGATTMIISLAQDARLASGARTEQGPPAAAAPPEIAQRILVSAGAPLYCLVDAAADAELRLLGTSSACIPLLPPGDPLAAGRTDPRLLALRPQSPLLSVLLKKGWGKGWASYFTSGAAFEDISEHFKRFLTVQVEGGRDVYFRFYDPRVLRDFLPTANPSEMVVFFGPVTSWFLEGEDKKSLLKISNAADGPRTEVLSLDGAPR
jgi:hypothetical protein